MADLALVHPTEKLRVVQKDVLPHKRRPPRQLRRQLAIGVPRVDHQDIRLPWGDEQIVALREGVVDQPALRHNLVQLIHRRGPCDI